MTGELLDRAHDQARTELGFCVQAPDGNWRDAHQALKFPGEEACRAMSVAYTIAESAVEVADPIIGERIASAIEAMADDLDWDGAVATKGELEAVRDYAVGVLHDAAAIARGDA